MCICTGDSVKLVPHAKNLGDFHWSRKHGTMDGLDAHIHSNRGRGVYVQNSEKKICVPL